MGTRVSEIQLFLREFCLEWYVLLEAPPPRDLRFQSVVINPSPGSSALEDAEGLLGDTCNLL